MPVTLLDKFKGKNVLVIGDVMLDRYLSGSVTRISPEAPVPVLNHQDTQERPGGAANVALNLSGLDANVFLASVTGTDSHGHTLKSLLDKTGINTEALILSDSRITTAKTRIMAQSQHLLRLDQEVTKALDRETGTDLMEALEKLFHRHKIDMVILQDYNKGVLNISSIPLILAMCQQQDIPVAVDPKFDNFYLYSGVSIFKPNLAELRAALPFEIMVDEPHLRKAGSYLKDKLRCTILLVTLSDKGIYVFNGDESHLLPAIKKSIIDVCGAGDTVISVAALAYLADSAVVEMARIASLAGTITCQYPGVVPITTGLLEQEYR